MLRIGSITKRLFSSNQHIDSSKPVAAESDAVVEAPAQDEAVRVSLAKRRFQGRLVPLPSPAPDPAKGLPEEVRPQPSPYPPRGRKPFPPVGKIKPQPYPVPPAIDPIELPTPRARILPAPEPIVARLPQGLAESSKLSLAEPITLNSTAPSESGSSKEGEVVQGLAESVTLSMDA